MYLQRKAHFTVFLGIRILCRPSGYFQIIRIICKWSGHFWFWLWVCEKEVPGAESKGLWLSHNKWLQVSALASLHSFYSPGFCPFTRRGPFVINTLIDFVFWFFVQLRSRGQLCAWRKCVNFSWEEETSPPLINYCTVWDILGHCSKMCVLLWH